MNNTELLNRELNILTIMLKDYQDSFDNYSIDKIESNITNYGFCRYLNNKESLANMIDKYDYSNSIYESIVQKKYIPNLIKIANPNESIWTKFGYNGIEYIEIRLNWIKEAIRLIEAKLILAEA